MRRAEAGGTRSQAMTHLHRCPGCGHEEECEEDCADPKEPWYCGAWPFQTERCLVLEEEEDP